MHQPLRASRINIELDRGYISSMWYRFQRTIEWQSPLAVDEDPLQVPRAKLILDHEMTKESSIFVDLRHRRLIGRVGPYYLISPSALPVVPAPEVSGMALAQRLFLEQNMRTKRRER